VSKVWPRRPRCEFTNRPYHGPMCATELAMIRDVPQSVPWSEVSRGPICAWPEVSPRSWLGRGTPRLWLGHDSVVAHLGRGSVLAHIGRGSVVTRS